MAKVPACLSDIDAVWLTSALREAGHDAPEVTSFDFEPMPGVVGALGEVGIFTVNYSGDTDLPNRFVAKCPLDHDAARIYNGIMQYYMRETGFYRDIAHDVPMNAARGWIAQSEGDRHIVLLDFVEGKRGDILDETSFDVVHGLVGDCARLHGKYWMDDSLRRFPWVLDWKEPSFLTGVEILQNGFSEVTEREPDLIPKELKEACAVTLDDVPRWLEVYAQRPWTFVHGDYQMDNFVFGGDDVVVLDWQGCQLSFPGMDLAWLLVSAASADVIAREDQLVDHYRSVLASSGGPSWSRDDVVEDLAWAMVHFVRGMTLPYNQDYSEIGPQGERMHRRFEAFMHRSVEAALRWGTAERIAEYI